MPADRIVARCRCGGTWTAADLAAGLPCKNGCPMPVVRAAVLKRPVGRPPLPSGPPEHLSIRLPRDVVARYRAEAERTGVTLGAVLREVIEAGLARGRPG